MFARKRCERLRKERSRQSLARSSRVELRAPAARPRRRGDRMTCGRFTMKLPRRNFLHLAASAAALSAVSRTARAQAYPSRPVRVIVPFAPAGDTDLVARLMGQWLSERLG